MEEVENKEKNESQQALSADKVKMIAAQLQQKCVMLENKLRSIDITAMRLNFLFQILANKDAFPADFITGCSQEIMDLMSAEPEESEQKEGK